MAIEVTRKDNNKLAAYVCPSCGQLYQIIPEPDEKTGVERSRKLADECCPPRQCTRCNAKPVSRGTTLCPECTAEVDVQVEAQRSAAATKLKEADWKGPVYWPQAPFDGDHGGRYWSTVAALRADVVQRNAQRAASTPPKAPIEMPAYVYATKPILFRLDGNTAIELALEDQSDDARERITEQERARLQKFLDDWAQKQGISAYEEDLSRVVVLG
jgi:hypothetical protein